ncbi:MAG: hypothetical protein EZS28_020045 [Streblomastix strix]|uniref:Reverse transcriptase domain-containing protein n=1 Tax=Streblomastix strix TaxID=222440 RepID=A0A5J4VP69_9EUKA|nr:MAG: hypothetical protein EZS28_020045 [Streblomastix strix]
MDCRSINKYLKDVPFQNENFKNVFNLSTKGDWATIIDIHNAYNHVLISDELQKFLAFDFQGRTYTYVGIPFGLKSAPYIFNQHLQPATTRLRQLGIRIIAHIDDIQILNQNPESLVQQTVQVKELLEKLEFLRPLYSDAIRQKNKVNDTINQMEQIFESSRRSSKKRSSKDHWKADIHKVTVPKSIATYETPIQAIESHDKQNYMEQCASAIPKTKERLDVAPLKHQEEQSLIL